MFKISVIMRYASNGRYTSLDIIRKSSGLERAAFSYNGVRLCRIVLIDQ